MIYAAQDYRVKADDNFFFDNNIWMLLYGLIGNYEKKKQKAYGDLFAYIKQRNRPIFINSLVISEFVNANIRSEYQIWKMKPLNAFNNDFKKNYLRSPEYQTVSQNIIATVKAITAITTKGNDDFNAINLNNVFIEMNHCDFNDAYYLHHATLKKYIIVTDDGDLYKNNRSGISIITYNP